MVLTIAVLVGFYRAGRIKRRRELVLAAAVIVGVGIFFGRMENSSNAKAEILVATLFGLEPQTDHVVFRARGSKGAPTLKIDAIYELPPETFESLKSREPSLEPPVSFRYWVGGWNTLTVDRFKVAAGALEWRDLPRTYRTADYYHAERGHYSRQRTPDERDMSGQFVCAFISVERESGPYDVVPCSTLGRARPAGITILGVLNEKDNTLHVMIE